MNEKQKKSYNQILREQRTGMEWKKVVEDTPSQYKMYNWRAFAMLEYIRHMIEDGRLGKDIIDVIYNYEEWIIDEVND